MICCRRFSAPALAFLVMLFGVSAGTTAQTAPVAAIGTRMPAAGFMSAPGFKLSETPSSVVSTDLDGDGRPDLIVAFASAGKVVVYLGAGMGKFQPPVAYNAGGHPEALVAADVNGDGQPDIVTANGADGTVSVLLGSSGGKLGIATVTAVKVSADYLAAGDLNGDGAPDVLVASRSGKALAILMNDSHGKLQAASIQVLGAAPTALVTGDFNGDRHLDAVVASDDGTVEVLAGGGDGTLRVAASFAGSATKIGSLVAADFNGDGSLDLALTQSDGRLLTAFPGKGDGTFGAGVSYTVGNAPVFTAAVDVNGDGFVDLLTVNQGSNTVSVLLGKGDGSFQSADSFAVGDGPVALAAGDFYSKGVIGLVVVDAAGKTVNAIAGRGDGTFQAAPSYSGDLNPRAVASGDLNGDGLPDLVVANFCGSDAACANNGSLSVYLGQTSGGYKLASTQPAGLGPVSIALADLNADGKLDVVALNRGDRTLSVLLGAGDGTFREPATTRLVGSPVAVVASDFNQDGTIDLAVLSDCGSAKCTQPGSVDVFFGGGDGQFALASSFAVSYSPRSLAAGDLNGDGVLDLVVANACGKDASCSSTGTATVLLGGGKGSFAAQADIALSGQPSAIALRSTKHEGVSDIVVTIEADNTIAVLKGNGDGTFQTPALYAVGSSPRAVAIADLNGDGTPDVAVANAKDSTVSVLYGRLDGTLVAGDSYAVAAGPEALTSVAGLPGARASLVTANGNSSASKSGTEITSLLNAVPNAGSTPSAAVFTSVTPTNPAVNTAVTMQVTVTPAPPDGEAVTFSSDDVGTLTCATSATTVSGVASCTTSQLTAGARSLSATYAGDATYTASTAGPQPLPVTAAAASLNLALSSPSTTPTVNQGATYTATLSSTASFTPVAPSGVVSFTIGGQPVTGCPAVTLSATTLTASCIYAATSTSTLSVAASYTGDNNFTVSTQPTLSQAINPAPATLSLALSSPSTTPTVNQSATYIATFASAAGYTPTPPSGTVSFTIGGQAVTGCPAVTLSAAVLTANCAYTAASPSALAVAANYSGDANFSVAAQPALSQTINQASATLSLALTSPSTTPTVNQSATYTATFASAAGYTPTPPSGTISFTIGGQAVSGCPAVTVSATVLTASCAYTATSTATLAVAANYSGDTNFTVANQPALSQTINPVAATLSLAGPSTPPTVNQSVTFTATLAASAGFTPAAPTGLISFLINGQAISGCSATTVSATAPTASCTYIAQTAGSLPVAATYSNDANFTVASQPTLSQTVSAAPATLTLTASSATPTVNQNVTFTATLTSTAGFTPTAPAGIISIAIAGQPGATCQSTTLSATVMTATCTITAVSAGSATATASYAGDTNFVVPGGQSSPQTKTVNKIATTLALSQPSPSTINTNVTFTATLSATPTTPTTPGGTISFTVNGDATVCPAVTLSGGSVTATCVTSKLVYPSDVVVATYTGDANYTSPPSATVTQIVTKVNAQTTVSASPSSAVVNQPVTFTATLQGMPAGLVVPSGNVTFRQGGVVLCGGAIAIPAPASSTATSINVTCQTSFAAVNSTGYTVTATYSGDSNFNPGAAGTAPPVLVGAQPTTLALAATVSPSAVDQATTFTATIGLAYPGTAVPSGTINFIDQTTSPSVTLCANVPVNASSASASCSVPLLYSGVHSIVAAFTASSPGGGASPNFGSSTSSIFPQTVNPAATTLNVVTSSASVLVNAPVTLTATVTKLSDPTYTGTTLPAGTIAFSDGPVLASATPISGCTAVAVAINGTAQCQQATFSTAGTHTVNAVYTPGTTPAANFLSSAASVPQVVGLASTSVAITSSVASPTVDQAVNFAATLTFTPGSGLPTGLVKFTDTSTGSTSTGTVFCTVPLAGNASPLSATCSTSAYAFLTSGTHQVTATYVGDANFTTNAGNFSLTVVPTPTTLTIAPTSQISPAVDQQVTFAINLTTNPATLLGTGRPQGTVTLTDSVLNKVLCAQTVAADGTVPSCTTSFLAIGTHTISASFAPSDTNFIASIAPTITQVVQPAATTLTVTSSSGGASPASVATQQVTFTATLAPTFTGAALPSGSIAFALTGDTIDTCPTVAVTTSAQPYTATCTIAFASSISGTVTIKATYTPTALAGGINFLASTGTATQTVQNFRPALTATSLATAVSPAGTAIASPIVTQGFTSATDPFNPATITVTSSSTTSFADQLSVASCIATNSAGVAQSSTFCTFANLVNTGTGNVATLSLSPLTSTPPGPYTLTVALTDPKAPALVQTTTLAINVVAQVLPSSLSAGAATGAFNVPFGVPSTTASYTFACSTILFNGQVSTAISCKPNVASGTVASNSFTITAGSTVTSMALPVRQPSQRIFVAAFFGIPLFALAGCLRRRGSRTSFMRFLAALIVLAGAAQIIGCGGGFRTVSATSSSNGPAVGTYLVLVTAKDATGLTYDAVISIAIKSATGS